MSGHEWRNRCRLHILTCEQIKSTESWVEKNKEENKEPKKEWIYLIILPLILFDIIGVIEKVKMCE
jgi:hypothetical protein